MPTDLFAGNPNYGIDENPSPAEQPKDLFGGNQNFGVSNSAPVTAAPPTEEPRQFGGTLGDIAMHGLAGAATAGRDFLNIPHNLYNKIPSVNKDFDYYKALGVNENIADKVGTGLLEYAPWGAGSAKLLASGGAGLSKWMAEHPKTAISAANAIGGGAYDVANGGNGIFGALIGGASPLPGMAINPVINYAAKKYAQSAIPEFTKKATDYIKQLPSVQDYANKLFNKFSSKSAENTANWKQTNNMAAQLSNQMKDAGMPFDDRPYQGYISDYLEKMSNLSPAQREPYNNAIQFAQHAQKLSPTSFEDTVALRQNMNSHLSDWMNKNEITKEDANAKEFVKGLKNTLSKDVLDANTFKPTDIEMGYEGRPHPDDVNAFKNIWEKSNKSHQGLMEFYKSQQPSSGVIKPVRQTREMYDAANKTGQLDPSILNKYAPRTSLQSPQGTAGVDQLGKLLEEPQMARNASVSSLFRRPVEQGATGIDVAKIYSDMSPQQQAKLFGGTDTGKYLDAINNTRLQFGREPEKTLAKIGHGVMSYGLPGAIGFGAGLASGENWDKAALTGIGTAAASKGLGKIAGKTATPASVNRAIKLGSTPYFQRPGRYINPFLQQANPFTGNNQ